MPQVLDQQEANQSKRSTWFPFGTKSVPRYESGILPLELVAKTRSTIRAAGMRQEDAARRIGISRPQLANALQRRYGLSVEVASRLHAFLEMPPPVRQLELC
jgi:DNA-binding XRE family transcriptional regulator